ncbi:MAG: M23 family metallopeptidase [Oscillochloris sp.]|nr:M23 family metallopeptidase [Oscillochloris sp.]
MYGGRHDTIGLRTVVLALALIGLIYLFFNLQGTQNPQISFWSPIGNSATSGLFGQAQGRGFGPDARPQGNPLADSHTVMTQGYGVGTHAPAATWGAVDLAIDGNGDRTADPEGSLQHPIYATHSGVVKLTPNSWPAGNHIWVSNDQYRTGYSHLVSFAVADGQTVAPGDLIGYLGSSGQSSGPHLDYQVWQMQAGQWANQNPLDFGALDGVP